MKVQKAQRVPNRINLQKIIPRHVIIKMAKIKERILKATRKKKFYTRKLPHGYKLTFQTLKAKGGGMVYLKLLKGKKCNQELEILELCANIV